MVNFCDNYWSRLKIKIYPGSADCFQVLKINVDASATFQGYCREAAKVFANMDKLYDDENTKRREPKKDPPMKKEDPVRRQPNWTRVAEDELIKAVEDRKAVLFKRSTTLKSKLQKIKSWREISALF